MAHGFLFDSVKFCEFDSVKEKQRENVSFHFEI
jgi:hypothetical protein